MRIEPLEIAWLWMTQFRSITTLLAEQIARGGGSPLDCTHSEVFEVFRNSQDDGLIFEEHLLMQCLQGCLQESESAD